MKALRAFRMIFIGAELAIYGAILYVEFTGSFSTGLAYAGLLLAAAMSAVQAIILRNRETVLLLVAMLFTAVADYFLVLLDGPYETAVSVFFFAQIFHFLRIFAAEYGEKAGGNGTAFSGSGAKGETGEKGTAFSGSEAEDETGDGALFCGVKKRLLRSALFRVLLMAVGIGIALLLKMNEYLYIAAVCYFVNLCMNAADSGRRIPLKKRFIAMTVGFVLFIFCDITVGMNGIRGTLNIPAPVMTVIADLTWVFYLPSQVLIVLSAGSKEKVSSRDGKRKKAGNGKK